MTASSTQIRLASELGALCARVHDGQLDAAEFLSGLLEATEADGALLSVRLEDGSVAAWTTGLDDLRARRLLGDGIDPPGLDILVGARPAWRLPEPGTAHPSLQESLEEELLNKLGVERLVRVGGVDAALLLCRFAGRDDFSPGLVQVFGLLRRPLTGAFDALRTVPGAREHVITQEVEAFAPRIDTDAMHAWGACPVPLVLLDQEGHVLAANQAARRKVDVQGDPPTLPIWLCDTVTSRLRDLHANGLPDDASGDYQFVRPAAGRRLVRLSLAPVAMDDDGDEPRWLLSVEHGGPTLEERIAATVACYALTEKEADILDLLAEGMTNRTIADSVQIAEASVKYRLKRIMEKTGTENRTDLLATVYSQTPQG